MVQENCEQASHCPANKAADILGDKWILLILRAMTLNAQRYSDFTSAIPRISPSVLSGKLKKMCELGLIVRRGETGQQSTYRLTPSGREVQPILALMGNWGLKWAQRHTSVDQLDVGQAMWDLHRSIDVAELPDGENVLAFKLTDLDKHNHWWVIASQTKIDLCNEDPRKPVDIYINGPLQVILDVWMGERELQDALSNEGLMLTGERLLSHTANHWFPLAPPVRATKKDMSFAQTTD